MIASIPQIQSALNFYLNRILNRNLILCVKKKLAARWNNFVYNCCRGMWSECVM